MSPTKRCLVCPNTSRSQPNMIFVQMPHPKKEARSRRSWFAVYQNILPYNEQLDCHLCSDHFNLQSDASNLDYYMAKRMKKLLFKPHALPRPLPLITTDSSESFGYNQIIKEERLDYLDEEDGQSVQEEQMLEDEDLQDTDAENDSDPLMGVKEEPLDIDEHEIINDPIDIKLEPQDAEEDVSLPSPPPLVPAITVVSSAPATTDNLAQQQNQPFIINSFQVANQQLRSQLLRLAAEGRLRVVNVTSSDKAGTTPTLAVVAANDGLVVNASAGLIQKANVVQQHPQRPQMPPQLVQRPPQQVQQIRMMPMLGRGQPGQTVRLANGQQLMMNGQVLQLRPTIPNSPNTASMLRHQLILPGGASIVNTPATNQPLKKLPSLAPLPMRSVFACNKCTELFYTTTDRDKHIETKHPGSLYVGSANAPKGKVEGQKEFKCEFCNVTMPFNQKTAHLATHETFKCVTCHQTLEKRIYAAHMISHIETPTHKYKTKKSPAILAKRSGQVKTIRTNTTKMSPPPQAPERKTAKQQTKKSKNIDGDMTVFEVKNLNNEVDESDVEKNLDEYMIPKDNNGPVKKRSSSSRKPKAVDMGSGMEMYCLFTCKICRMAFRTKMELVKHRDVRHKDILPTASLKRPVNMNAFIKCAYCFQDVIRTKLATHIRVMHPTQVNICPICKVSFTQYQYAKHLRLAHSIVDPKQTRKEIHSVYRRVDSTKVVKTSTKAQTSSSEVQDESDDMDYDEDYPLAMLLRQPPNAEPNSRYRPGLHTDEVEISDIEDMDDDEGDTPVCDAPDYVDITQYEQVMT